MAAPLAGDAIGKKGTNMSDRLQKMSLPLLTAYAAAVAVGAAVNWGGLALTQQLAAIATVIVCCHEWEEQRFPGGFLEMMGSILGLDTTGVEPHRMYSKPDVLIFAMTILALTFPQVPAFACALLVLGCYEGVVHVMGIKLGKLSRPYTPGLVTAEVYAAFSIVGIVMIARAGAAGALDWVLGIVWFILGFAVMEACVWRVVGLSPKEIPAKFREKVARK